jgi:hypothetical protein
MIVADTVASQQSIPDVRFKTAGWVCFFEIILVIPTVIVAILTRSQPPILRLMIFIYIPLAALGCGCTVYVLTQFKRLLNERYDFHGGDQIILGQIVLTLIAASTDILSTTITTLLPALEVIGYFFLGIGILEMVIAGIIGIVLGVRLLDIRDDSTPLLRPYAIISIIASSCLAVVILVPITLVLTLPLYIIMGMIFLRAAESEAQVEFV